MSTKKRTNIIFVKKRHNATNKKQKADMRENVCWLLKMVGCERMSTNNDNDLPITIEDENGKILYIWSTMSI